MTVAIVVGTAAIVAVAIAIGVIVDRKTSILPRPNDLDAAASRAPRYAAGEAPSTAIRVGTVQLARLRESRRCPACRAAMISEPEDLVRFDERELVILKFRCPDCAAKQSVYVIAGAA